MTTAYPLAWPDGWKRTSLELQQDSKHRFARPGKGEPLKYTEGRGRGVWTFAAARDELFRQLNLLGATPGRTVLSTNYELNSSGLPRGDRRIPSDRGVAVYFELDQKPMVMACDMHIRAEENMRSLALSIEALRALDRHGGGIMREKAFTGFAALPPPGGAQSAQWWVVLGVSRDAGAEAINAAYKARARERHPDAGGSDAAMSELNGARTEALKAVGGSNGR